MDIPDPSPYDGFPRPIRNPEALHRQIVWPIKPSPCSTAYWNDEDWLKYVRSFRPKDYAGGETDQEAWAAHLKSKETP